jgi:hypothetical protein
MIKKILPAFLLLFTMANAKIAVVHSRASNLAYAEKMVVRLSSFTECRRFSVDGREGLLQIIDNPEIEMLVILSTVTAEDYAKIIREDRRQILPHVTILDEVIREDYVSTLVRHGVVCVPVTDPALAVRGLANRYGISINCIGYIYNDGFRNVATTEMAQLRTTDISSSGRILRVPILPDEFAYGIGRFYTNNISVYRFLGRDPIFSFLQQEPSMLTFVERRATPLIVDTRDYVNLFEHTPVVLLEKNESLLERIATIIVLTTFRDKKTRFTRPIIIRTTSVTLFNDESPRGENLIVGEELLFRQTDEILRQIKRQDITTDELWRMALSSLGSIVDTTASPDKQLSIISSRAEMIENINRMIGTHIFGYVALVVIIFMIVLKMFESYQKKRYKRRIALLMPGSINKISLLSTDGSNIPLKILLENEGYQTKLTSSLKGFRKVMRKNFPNIVVADWDAARVMLQLFYQEFTNSHKFSQVGIILVNIPLNKQTQIKKLFGGASVYCYDEVPTLDDVQAHLRGDKHFSSYSEGSYMSGIIQEDNLTAILQMIEGNMYTGCLVVEENKPISVVYFRSGRVVFAVDKSGESGVKSIYNALNCRRGNFYFHLNRTAQNETLNLGTMEILMGWAEQRDRFTKKISAIESEK